MVRRHFIVVLLFTFVLSISALLFRLWSVPLPEYKWTFLGKHDGELILPGSINDDGQIAGFVGGPNGTRVFFRDPNGSVRILDALGGKAIEGGIALEFALDMNNRGHVVGCSQTATGVYRAILWDKTAGIVELGTLGGSESLAFSINNADQVVGWSQTATGFRHAVLWDKTKGVVDIGTLGGNESIACGVNETCQVVGFSQVSAGHSHAFLWDPNNGMKDLGAANLQPTELLLMPLIHLNNKGFVVGRFGSATEQNIISTWSEATGLRCLPLPGRIDAYPIALNESNQFIVYVGPASQKRGRQPFVPCTEAYLWDPNEGYLSFMKILGDRDVHMFIPKDINNKGQILFWLMRKESDNWQGVLLEPKE